MYFTFISACFSIICNCKLIKYNWESYKVIKLNKGINLCFRSAQLYTSNVPPLNTYITTIPQWFCLIFPFFVQNESCCRQPLPGMKVWFWKYIKTEYVYLNIIMSSSKVKYFWSAPLYLIMGRIRNLTWEYTVCRRMLMED